MAVFVGGCRSQPGGLHWGHVFGCFADLDMEEADTYFFIVSDGVGRGPSDRNDTARIAREALAWVSFDPRVYVVSESSLQRELLPLAELVQREVPLSWLQAAHPHRQRVRTGNYRGSIADFLFPIRQATYILGLRADVACYNDDNALVVKFAADCADRLMARGATPYLTIPELMPRGIARLPGRNGERMCKANQNTLPLLAPVGDVRKYVSAVVGRAIGTGVPMNPSEVTSIEHALFRLLAFDDVDRSNPDGHVRIESLTTAFGRRIGALAEALGQVSERDAADALELGRQVAIQRIRELVIT